MSDIDRCYNFHGSYHTFCIPGTDGGGGGAGGRLLEAPYAFTTYIVKERKQERKRHRGGNYNDYNHGNERDGGACKKVHAKD